MSNKFCVGDKVRVKSIFGKSIYFTNDHLKYSGKTMTISKAYKNGFYLMEETGTLVWSEEYLEELKDPKSFKYNWEEVSKYRYHYIKCVSRASAASFISEAYENGFSWGSNDPSTYLGEPCVYHPEITYFYVLDTDERLIKFHSPFDLFYRQSIFSDYIYEEDSKKKSSTVKPPLGIEPERIWKQERLDEIQDAIGRYVIANLEPLPEWIEEGKRLYKELM